VAVSSKNKIKYLPSALKTGKGKYTLYKTKAIEIVEIYCDFIKKFDHHISV
jgi:hypothetical protein